MKKMFLIVFWIFNPINIYSQKLIEHNIYIQKLSYSTENCYSDKKGGLVFFTNVYSADELKLGLLDINDSLTVKKISVSKNKFAYFLKQTYEKDTIENSFKLSKVVIDKRIDSHDLNRVIFKKIPSLRTVFDCNEIRYKNVLLLKSFFLTHSLIFEDDKSTKYSIKLIDENCNTLLEEDYNRNLLFSQNDRFLIFKDNDRLILIFDKYL
jgi:hypothetical protein